MFQLDTLNSLLGSDDGTLQRMRQIAQEFCPEDLQDARQDIIPDEELHIERLQEEFRQLLEGGLPFSGKTNAPEYNSSKNDNIVKEDGFGIGIPETEKLRHLKYEETDTLNIESVKKDFPVLNQKVNGHQLIWLDNGATTQKPIQVIDKISDYYKNYNSNIHRGAHTLAARATDAYEEARSKVKNFINASSEDEIIFVRGTTEGINLVAQSYGRQFLTPGDNVIVSELDHHANIVPWQRVCQEKGCELKAIPTDKNGDLILSELERLITPRTRFVSVGHVNNTFGTINDVERIISIAHAHHVPVLIDGAQSIAHTPVDVQSLDADFFDPATKEHLKSEADNFFSIMPGIRFYWKDTPSFKFYSSLYMGLMLHNRSLGYWKASNYDKDLFGFQVTFAGFQFGKRKVYGVTELGAGDLSMGIPLGIRLGVGYRF